MNNPLNARKQIYLDTLFCKKVDSVPFYAFPYRAPMGFMDEIEKGPRGGGLDGFGVLWENTPEGAIPSSASFLLEDIRDWETYVKFPDLENINWEEKAKADLAPYDKDSQVIEYGMGNAHFERLVALMGFENGLCALLEEPGACAEFMDAFTEYRIAYARKIARYYHPDIICSYDDVAHVRGTFMSQETYQQLIKPYHKKFNDEVKRLGIIPIQHCCGKAESLIEDFIEEGAQCWCSVQPVNDIETLLKTYGAKISICGGFDTNKLAAMGQFTEDDLRVSVDEAIDKYAKYGSFILGNFTIMAGNGKTKEELIQIIADEALRYGTHYNDNSH